MTFKKLRRLLVLTDFVAISLALAAAYVLRFGAEEFPVSVKRDGFMRLALSPQVQSAVVLTLWLFLLANHHSRDRRILGVGSREYRRTVRAGLSVLVYLAVFVFIFKIDLPRLFISYAIGLGILTTLTGRWAWRQAITRLRQKANLIQRVAVIGPYDQIRDVAKRMLASPIDGFLPVLLIPDLPTTVQTAKVSGRQIPVVTVTDALLPPLQEHAVEAVFIIGSATITEDVLKRVSWRLEGSGIDLIVASNLLDISSNRLSTRSIAGLAAMTVDIPRFTGLKFFYKRMVDIVFATIALLLSSPVLLLAIAAVWIEDQGPVFFTQERIGRGGKPFKMYKIRSMRVGAEKSHEILAQLNESPNTVMFKSSHDPRVTRCGAFIRRFSIDELPQFVNVLAGHMSVVGPRPPLPSEVAKYEAKAQRRLLVNPGVTGLWQVSGRNSLSWDDTVRLDLDYVENWSVVGDLLIVLKTFAAVLRGSGSPEKTNGDEDS
ncbi:MAG: sugar transferase [Micrococcales bacterium]